MKLIGQGYWEGDWESEAQERYGEGGGKVGRLRSMELGGVGEGSSRMGEMERNADLARRD